MVARSKAAREIVELLPAVAINLRLATLMDLDGIDLTANQLLALQLVALAPDGRMKAGDIAGRLGISSQAGTALVDRLVSAGVVDRSHGEDRRVVWVSVTDAGRELLNGLAAGLEKLIGDALETGYDAATLDGLVEGLRRVASFADRIGDPAARSSPRHRRATASPPPP
ncbi:MAG: MarR family transcriptional regulator [Candidatus Limnocylindrales bacterium]|jgi:DNA-binding MarR family transcriptional regulator